MKKIVTSLCITGGAATVIIGTPLVIGMAGFTTVGIAAGSIAAKMMSAAALANGGGVAAGGTVAILQSIGAAGFSIAGKVALGAIGGGLGAASSSALLRR